MPEDSKNVIFNQILRDPNFSTKRAGMPCCYGVKFICRWNWLKIEIWDLQAPYINGMHLVSLVVGGPYPRFGCTPTWCISRELPNEIWPAFESLCTQTCQSSRDAIAPSLPAEPGDSQRKVALEDGEAAPAQFAREQLVVDVEDDVREEEFGAWKREEEGEGESAQSGVARFPLTPARQGKEREGPGKPNACW